MNIIKAFKQADKVELFVVTISVLAVLMLIVLTIASIASGDTHSGQHCVQHVLMPFKAGSVTTYQNICTEWASK